MLRAVSAEEKAVGTALSNTGADSALDDAASGMSGLHSADGCQSARSTLETANRLLNTDLGSHSEKLDSAAQQYEATDAASGLRLQQSMQ